MQNAESGSAEYVTVRQLVERFSFTSEGAIRKWLFLDAHGFRSRCARQIGRRIVIDVRAFEAWIDSQKSGASTTPRAA